MGLTDILFGHKVNGQLEQRLNDLIHVYEKKFGKAPDLSSPSGTSDYWGLTAEIAMLNKIRFLESKLGIQDKGKVSSRKNEQVIYGCDIDGFLKRKGR